MPPGLDIRLLGPVRVEQDGAELAVGTDRQTAVLCMLALLAGQAVPREDMMAAVWGESPPASAVGSLYTYVSGLRRALEPNRERWSEGTLLSSRSGLYELRIPETAVDALRFERAHAQSRQSRAAGDREGEFMILEAALGLWRGEALAGIPGPFAAEHRMRLGELRLSCVERHATLLLEAGRPEDAIGRLRELTGTYPLQERFPTLLMTALETTGQRAEALAVYWEARRVLRELVGAGPGPGLESTYRRIHDNVRSGALPPRKPRSLIGRDGPLSLFRTAVVQVAQGRGGTLRIEGGPGIGKSALLDAVSSSALSSSMAPVRVGRASGAAVGAPLGVLRACLRTVSDGPEWMDVGDEVDGAVELVRRTCEQAPLVLMIDDLHQADEATLRAWARLGPLTAKMPLLLLAAARPDRAALDSLGLEGALTLGPLPPREAAALAAFAAPALDESARVQAVESTSGNPGYLLAALAGEATLAVLIEKHLAEYSESTQRLLRAAALLGDSTALVELAVITGSTTPVLRAALAPARSSGLVTGAEDTVTFRHRIVAHLLRSRMPTALRAGLHREFADRLAATGEHPERVVAQLVAGRVPLDPALGDWLLAHVEQAAERAPRDTLALLEAAREQTALDPPTRLALAGWLARLLAQRDRDAISVASWVAARATDPELEAEMRWLVATAQERQGEFDAAADTARWALSTRRTPEPWPGRFRELLTRLRPRLGGTPTEHHTPTGPVKR